jgi:hypothetical protein
MANSKLSLCLIKHYATEMCEGGTVSLHVFMNSALDISEWSALRPGRFTLREKASSIH